MSDQHASNDSQSAEPEGAHKPASKRTHWKSQSMSEVDTHKGRLNGGGGATSFFQNRELWQRRAASQSTISSDQTVNQVDSKQLPAAPTPDLVMDLPTNPEEPSGGLESPDMTTAAERFAKQNQCTLKKNSKPSKPDPSTCSPVLLKKPQIKIKPEVMKKPVGLVQSPNVIRKEHKP